MLLHSEYFANVFFFFFTFCYRAFLFAHGNSVCAAVVVLYNTLVTSYIFWAHHIMEYCAKNVQLSGHNETSHMSHYLNFSCKDVFVFLIMGKLQHESGLLLLLLL